MTADEALCTWFNDLWSRTHDGHRLSAKYVATAEWTGWRIECSCGSGGGWVMDPPVEVEP